MRNETVLKLLIVLIALFLSACATSPAKDDSHASDLDALLSGARNNLKPRPLPNGKYYCIEDAVTEEAKDNCSLDLEDGKWQSEQDKARALDGIERGVERLRLARNPCSLWERLTRRDRCTVP